MRSWIRQPQRGRLTRSPGAVPRITNSDWRTFSSSCELDTPPLRLIDTGKRSPLPRKSFSFDMLLVSEPTLDEFSALATRDSRRLLHFFDRQRTVVAVRARDFVRSPVDHHVEHVLPRNEGFLFHRESFRFDPFEH